MTLRRAVGGVVVAAVVVAAVVAAPAFAPTPNTEPFATVSLKWTRSIAAAPKPSATLLASCTVAPSRSAKSTYCAMWLCASTAVSSDALSCSTNSTHTCANVSAVLFVPGCEVAVAVDVGVVPSAVLAGTVAVVGAMKIEMEDCVAVAVPSRRSPLVVAAEPASRFSFAYSGAFGIIGSKRGSSL